MVWTEGITGEKPRDCPQGDVETKRCKSLRESSFMVKGGKEKQKLQKSEERENARVGLAYRDVMSH